MKFETVKKRYLEVTNRVPDLGERHTLCNWVLEDDGSPNPLIEMHRYGQLLQLLPDNIVENLEKSRLSREGRMPMIRAGLGYQELLATVIVDGTAVHDSSTEGFLFPALLLPQNYLQPGGIPGRQLRWVARGRNTTLATAGTMTFKFGAALTNVIPTTTWCVSGAVTQDAAVHTNEQWKVLGDVVVRSVGSAGTVFAQGDSSMSSQAATVAANTASFMGSAGSATPATAAVDTTQAQYISLTAKWSLTTAYSITGHIFAVESMN
jgi:hypothetical protein